MKKFSYSFLIFFLMLFSSCVSKKKYLACQDRVSDLVGDSSELATQLQYSNNEYQKLKTTSEQRQNDLVNQLEKKQNELKRKEDEIKDREGLLSEKNKELYERAKQLRMLQRQAEYQNQLVNNLKKTVADALVNLKSDELSLEVKNGRVYVSLAEKLLFESGSDKVDEKGKTALHNLAEVLKKNPEVEILVEGHTDTVPISTTRFADNWDLSVKRATSIVRVLTDAGVDPKRLIASGKSQYHPVATNDTKEGRAKNRRTEIILSPNLEKLYQMIEESSKNSNNTN